MANVGFATLTIIPTAKGFKKRLEEAVSSDIDEVGRSAGSEFGQSFQRSVTSHVQDTSRTIRDETSGALAATSSRFARFGSTVSKSFGSIASEFARFNVRIAAIGPALGTLAPAIIAVSVAAVGALVAIGSAAAVTAGAIGSAFAGIAIGAAIFSQTERGEAALAQFKRRAGVILEDAAAPLTESFEFALQVIRGTLGDIKPLLAAVFGTLGGVVERGVTRATNALKELAPAMAAITAAGSAFFDAFTSTFGLIAGQLTPALQELAPTLSVVASILGVQLGSALARLLPMLIDLAERALPVLPVLFRLAAGAIRGLIGAANLFLGAMGGLIIAVNQARIALNKLIIAWLRVVDILPGVNANMAIAISRIRIMGIRAQSAAVHQQFFGNQAAGVSGALLTQNTRLNQARVALIDYDDEVLGAIQNQINYQRQLDLTSQELREGAASLNLNTKEGRENAQAILDLVSEGRKHITTLNEQGRSTQFTTNKAQQFTRELVREARQAGFTNEELGKLITSSRNIPKSIKQDIRSNAASVEDVIQDLINTSENFEGTYTRTFHTVFTSSGDPTGVQFFAEGGIVRKPTPAVIGESGPEAVIPLDDPRRAAQLLTKAGLTGPAAAGDGAALAAGVTYQANFYGPVGRPRDARRTVIDAFHDFDTLHPVRG